MPRVIVIGGGLAGLSAAAALGSTGFTVDVFEARGFLGGRATSYPVASSEDETELIDNCQHVLLRCCVNLLDFYSRLAVADKIRFYHEYYFVEPGGHVSILKRGRLPAPLHLTASFLKMNCFGAADKLAITRAMLALMRERRHRQDLEKITMLDWLREKRQTPRAIERFWRQVLVSAVNEELDRMAAAHAFQVFWLGMLARVNNYEMGVPDVPLRELYSSEAWLRMENVRIHVRSPVDRIAITGGAACGVQVAGVMEQADYYVCSVPFERIATIAPDMRVDTVAFTHSPITGIHVWFDQPVTELPHAALLDRNIQWMFNKSEGRYLQFVVSASRKMVEMSRQEIIALALQEAAEFFPKIQEAKLERATVIKDLRATFSARPGMEVARPQTSTHLRNVFLAGDWTKTGWPATMEGAVRSGYLAAEAVSIAAGTPQRFLLADLA